MSPLLLVRQRWGLVLIFAIVISASVLAVNHLTIVTNTYYHHLDDVH